MNPYSHLPKTAYWRTAVANHAAGSDIIPALWHPKFTIEPDDKILTAGSCFAQHIGKSLRKYGFSWYIPEAAPYGLSEKKQTEFHYGLFSFRTGNIYTTAMMEQWLRWSLNPETQDTEIWEEDGCFYDPVRPQIEPGGFESRDDLFEARTATFDAFKTGIQNAAVFVFTLGLTEQWVNRNSGLIYAGCPGTQRGVYDENDHVFHNLTYLDVFDGLVRIRALLHEINPNIKMLLTISPVPLVATAAPDAHVLTATSYSKAVLRAAAGAFCDGHADVDYFPSYEIVTTPALQKDMFEDNRRSVRPETVDFVMAHFFDGFDVKPTSNSHDSEEAKLRAAVETAWQEGDVVCEEIELERFNTEKK